MGAEGLVKIDLEGTGRERDIHEALSTNLLLFTETISAH
jgi:hypothetical protein